MKLLSLLMVVAIGSLATAARPPLNVCKAFSKECSGVQAQAVQFCSSFLKPQTTTSTVSAATTIVSSVTITTTVTAAPPACTKTQAGGQKRAAAFKSTPAPFKGKPANAISTLCSCLVTAPAKSTVTKTSITTTIIATTTVTAPAPACCTFPPISSISCPQDDRSYFQADTSIYEVYCNSAVNADGGLYDCELTPFTSYKSCFDVQQPDNADGGQINGFFFQDTPNAVIQGESGNGCGSPISNGNGQFVCAAQRGAQYKGIKDSPGFNAAARVGFVGDVIAGFGPTPVCQAPASS